MNSGRSFKDPKGMHDPPRCSEILAKSSTKIFFTLEINERFLQRDYIWNTYTLIWLTGTGLGVVQKLLSGLKKRAND